MLFVHGISKEIQFFKIMEYYKQSLNWDIYPSIIANFIGDLDRIITVKPNGLIMWLIYQRILVLDNIILTPSLIHISQINLDFVVIRLQVQIKKHAVEIEQSLKEANYQNEIDFTKNLYKCSLQKLVAIRSSFNNL